MSSTITRVGVIGCGLMGSGIAEVSAKAGLDVIVVESNEDLATAGRKRIEASLRRTQEKGKIDNADEIIARIRVITSLDALADREIVIEAIREDEAMKLALFAELDQIVSAPDAILASNTSSIPISKIASATKRPGQVLGVHFFNPVPVLTLVELIPSLLTEDATVDRARAFVETQLGKFPILAKDKAGFVVNALLIPYLISAIRMFEAGVATAEDIDAGMVRGAAHPMGPLALADLIGLDTTKAVADSMYEEYKDAFYACPPLLARMVDAGLLGRKSGRGFYTY